MAITGVHHALKHGREAAGSAGSHSSLHAHRRQVEEHREGPLELLSTLWAERPPNILAVRQNTSFSESLAYRNFVL